MSDPHTTALETWQHTYVKTEEDGKVNASATAIGPWETWRIVQVDDTHIALLSNFDKYLCCDESYNVSADRSAIGPWETWRVVQKDDTEDQIFLMSNFGTYLCYDLTLTPPQIVANRSDCAEWETFTVTPWWKPDVPEAVNPLVGTIRANYDTGLEDSTGCRLAVTCHAGDFLARYYHDPDRIRGYLDQIAQAGYHGVRTWTVLRGSYWEGWGMVITPEMSGYWDTVCKFCDELKARGLRWLVSQGDLCAHYGQSDRKNFMRQLAEHLRDMGGTDTLIFGIDAGNETAWNGESDANALREVIDAYLAVQDVPIHTLTSWDEEHPNDYVVGDTQRDLHTQRNPWPQGARRVFNVGYETEPKLFTMYSEPCGQGAQEYGGDNRVGHHISVVAVPAEWNDNDPEIHVSYAAIHAIAKGHYTAFFSPGVISDEDFTNYAAFALIPQLYAMLPQDLGSWWTFHGGDGRSFSADRILAVPPDDSLDVRCDHAAGGGGDRICVVYGPEGSYSLKSVNHFKGRIINPHDLSCEDVEWAKDQMVTISFKYGRIIQGVVS